MTEIKKMKWNVYEIYEMHLRNICEMLKQVLTASMQRIWLCKVNEISAKRYHCNSFKKTNAVRETALEASKRVDRKVITKFERLGKCFLITREKRFSKYWKNEKFRKENDKKK